jgi:hypothetical protein
MSVDVFHDAVRDFLKKIGNAATFEENPQVWTFEDKDGKIFFQFTCEFMPKAEAVYEPTLEAEQ